MNTINEELHLRNINLQTKIDEMQAEVERLMNQNKDLCLPINRLFKSQIIVKPIQINDLENTYRILYSSQPKDFQDSDDIIIFEFTNCDDVYKVFRDLVQHYRFDFCRKLSTAETDNKVSIYQISDMNKFITFIHELKHNTFRLINYGYELKIPIDEAKNKLIENYVKYPKFCYRYRGKLYEYYCLDMLKSRNPNNEIYIWNHIPNHFKNEYNLSKVDYGKDIVDITSKIIYQCKYYFNETISSDCLYTFMLETKRLKEYGFKSVIICPNSSSFVKSDLIIFDEWKVEILRYDAEDMLTLLDNKIKEQHCSNPPISSDNVGSNDNITNNDTSNTNTKYSSITDPVKLFMINNWSMTDNELISSIHSNLNLTYKPETIRINRYKIMRLYPELKTPYNKREHIKDIREYILNNWNKTNKELLSHIRENIKEDYTSDSLEMLRKRMVTSNPNLKLPYNDQHYIRNYILNNWNLSNDEILSHIHENYDKTYKRSSLTNFRRRLAIENKDLITPTQIEKNNIKLIKQYVSDNWNLSNDELLSHIRENINKDYTLCALRHIKDRLTNKNI